MFGSSGNPLEIIFTLVALIVAITIHEFAHAWAAEHLGDPTPRLMGRLTLNPLAHLDPIGTIMMVLVHFGWGKPVIFDPFNLQHPRRDSALISIAGPISNFLMAIACSILLHLLFTFRLSLVSMPTAGVVMYVLIGLLEPILAFNVVLGVFNLVPIHPLDGFKIVEGALPEEYAKQWHELQPYGMIFLLFLIFPIFGGVAPISRIISPIISFLLNILLPNTPFI